MNAVVFDLEMTHDVSVMMPMLLACDRRAPVHGSVAASIDRARILDAERRREHVLGPGLRLPTRKSGMF